MFGRVTATPLVRLDPGKHLEVVPRYQVPADPCGGSVAEAERRGTVRDEPGEGPVTIAVVEIIGITEVIPDESVLNALEKHEFFRMADAGQRPEEYRVDQAENRSRRADAQCQGEHRHPREAFFANMRTP